MQADEQPRSKGPQSCPSSPSSRVPFRPPLRTRSANLLQHLTSDTFGRIIHPPNPSVANPTQQPPEREEVLATGSLFAPACSFRACALSGHRDSHPATLQPDS